MKLPWLTPMKTRTLLRIVISTAFFVVIGVAILFAEGYQYDSEEHQFVKKGVVYFEDGLSGASVTLDGKEVEVSSSGELRVPAGRYELVISKEGYFPWKKVITVPANEVLQFAPIRLFAKRPGASFETQLESTKEWDMISSSLYGFFLANRKLHVGKYYYLTKPETTFWIKDIPIKFARLVVYPDPSSLWHGIGENGRLFSYDTEHMKGFEWEGIERFIELYDANESMLGLDEKGVLWELARDSRSPRVLFQASAPIKSVTRIVSEPKHYLLLLSLRSGEKELVIIDKDGKSVFREKNVAAAEMRGDKVYYSRVRELLTYSLKEGRLISKKTIEKELLWLAQIGTTFHFLFLTNAKELLYCDLDFENCHSIAKLDSNFIEVAHTRTRFVAETLGHFTMFSFEEDGVIEQFLKQLAPDVF